jgi:hypothetical protein
VANIPTIDSTALVLVTAGMVVTVLLAIACTAYAWYGDRTSRPQPAHQKPRSTTPTISDEDGPVARLVRSSTMSTELGHRA